MKLKNKASLLAGMMAAFGVAYMPNASADIIQDLHTLGASSSTTIANALPSATFTDTFNFHVDSSVYSVNTQFSTSNGYALTSDPTNILSSLGVNIDAVWLVVGGSNVYADIKTVQSATALKNLPIVEYSTQYFATLNQVLGAGDYSLVISGTTGTDGANNGYTGNLSLSPAPVPLPGAWAMMLVGAPMLLKGMRRKQGKNALAAA